MGALQRLEHRLEQFISTVFARAFRSAVAPIELAAGLARELDNSAQHLSRDRLLVPNEFHIALSKTDFARLSELGRELIEELRTRTTDYAAEQAYRFSGPVTITLELDPQLPTGRFQIGSKAVASVHAGAPATDTQVKRAEGFIEVNGQKLPLLPPGIVVGRGSDVDLHVDDPSVSRQHLELRVESAPHGTQVSVHDLGSTNGILVNQQKVRTAVLTDGAHIRAGNTVLVYHATPGGGRV